MNSRCGNKYQRNKFTKKEIVSAPLKGFVFTVDVAIGLVTVMAILAASSFYVLSSGKSGVNEIALKKTGSDIVAVLDYEGVLDTFNKTIIERNMSGMLPFNMNMSMIVRKYGADGNFLEQLNINEDLDENYYTGRWLFVAFSGNEENFYVAEYKVAFR